MTNVKDRDGVAPIRHISVNSDQSETKAIALSEPALQATNSLESNKAHKILYPVRSSSDGCNSSSVKWTGLTALDMVERIAKMAISSSQLKKPAAGVSEKTQYSYSFLQYLANEPSTSSDVDLDLGAGQKRKRESFDEDYYEDISGCELVAASVLNDKDDSGSTALSSEFAVTAWRPSVIWANQFGQLNDNVRVQLNHLDSMVTIFEQLALESQNRLYIPSYNRVQAMFVSNIPSLASSENVRLALDVAVQQMQTLVEMSHPFTPSARVSRVKFSHYVSCQDGTKQLMAQPEPICILNGVVVTQTALSEKAKRRVFNAYMTEWICQSRNWTNPYPDETMLKQMANQFIHIGGIPGLNDSATQAEAIAKINTWLLNTRTRQWRPAVEEAFDGKRPAMLLMEDSLRIFKGDKLRPLIGWDNALFDDCGAYSKSITTCDKTSSKSDAQMSSIASNDSLWTEMTQADGSINGALDLFPQAQGALTASLDGLGLLEEHFVYVDDEDQDMMFVEAV